MVDRPRIPVRVQAYLAHIAACPLSDWLRDRIRPGGRVLSDHDRNCARVQRGIDLRLHGRLGAQDVVDRRDVVGLRRNVRVAEVDHAEMFKQVEVEVLNVTRVPDRLLPHALRASKPLGLVHVAVLLAPAGRKGRSDDDDVRTLEVLRTDGDRRS